MKAQFVELDLVMLCLSGGYALLTLLFSVFIAGKEARISMPVTSW